jgi:hypothetical protein
MFVIAGLCFAALAMEGRPAVEFGERQWTQVGFAAFAAFTSCGLAGAAIAHLALAARPRPAVGEAATA